MASYKSLFDSTVSRTAKLLLPDLLKAAISSMRYFQGRKFKKKRICKVKKQANNNKKTYTHMYVQMCLNLWMQHEHLTVLQDLLRFSKEQTIIKTCNIKCYENEHEECHNQTYTATEGLAGQKHFQQRRGVCFRAPSKQATLISWMLFLLQDSNGSVNTR